MNYNTRTIINGKKLTQPEVNLLTKLEELGMPFITVEPLFPLVLRNPVTGAQSHSLHPLVYSLAKFVLDAYSTYGFSGKMSYRGKPVTIQLFDRAKMLVLKLDPSTYRDLID